jgi:ubiquinone/menaquinone biosynthesis C-methylase UbiE
MAQFDPVKYKQTTRQQWQDAAAAWHRWGPTIDAWLGPATTRMLELAGIGPGQRVLDVAAGAGQQTIAIAERVGPSGQVVATDIAPAILEFAAAEARARGLAQVTTRVLDGEALDVTPQSFDAVVSRVGLIYFPDQASALASMARALRPGGRIAHVVYSTADRNGFFARPVEIIRRHARLGPPLPGQPGPFSLGGPGVIEAAYQQAGFRDIVVEAVPSPVRMASAADCLRFEQESFGALHTMLAALDEPARAAAWREVGEALREFEGPEGFVGPCEMLVAAARR